MSTPKKFQGLGNNTQGTPVPLKIAHFRSKKLKVPTYHWALKKYILRFCLKFFLGLLGSISTNKKMYFKYLILTSKSKFCYRNRLHLRIDVLECGFGHQY